MIEPRRPPARVRLAQAVGPSLVRRLATELRRARRPGDTD